MKIEELNLSVRTYACLKRAGIDTVEQLQATPADEPERIRHMGLKCLNEIAEKLRTLSQKAPMENKQLIEKLRELADLTPPICKLDNPEEIDVMGQKIAVYCKPFEQIQDTLRQAADRIEELERRRPKGRWEPVSKREDGAVEYRCTNCDQRAWYMDDGEHILGRNCVFFCSTCGAKMEGNE